MCFEALMPGEDNCQKGVDLLYPAFLPKNSAI
jgi:hypothetical protein